jgi:FkbM family methyltransferase
MNFQLALTRLDKLAQVIRSTRFLRTLLYHRVLAGAEHRQVLAADLATVIDIGANRGQFALSLRRWAPEARVIAFEPLAGPAARFRKVFKGDRKVILHQSAIGPETGKATIHVSAKDDSSSLLSILAVQERLFPGTGEVRTESVQVGRLCDYVSADEIVAPAMLKLDVQGFELAALAGCEDLIPRFVYVYVECSFVELYQGQAIADEIIAWLREQGFKLSGVYNLCYDKKGKAVQGDFLFAKMGGLTAD